MLLAIGNIDMGSLIDSLILMAKDNNQYHENNKEGKGTYKHEDGWGIAYYNNGKWTVTKSTSSCIDDDEIATLRNIHPKMALLHARKAIVGEKKYQNTQPFQYKDFMFMHNGHLKDPVVFAKKFKPEGQTDSEQFFYGLLTQLEKSDVPKDILEYLDTFKNYSALNFVLAEPDKTYAATKFSQKPNYFKMKLGKRSDLLVISSEIVPTIPNVTWSHMNDGDLIVINNLTLEFKHYIKEEPDEEVEVGELY